MCVAIEEMRKESENIGEIKGAILMCKELGLSLPETIEKIVKKFGITKDVADGYVEDVWD